MSAGRKETDWRAVERDYRAGLPVRAIGRKHCVSHTAIQKRAAKQSWQRDLAPQIHHRAEQKVAEAVAKERLPVAAVASSATSDEAIVEANASYLAEVKLAQLRLFARSRQLAEQMLRELETLNNDEELVEWLEEIANGDIQDPKQRDRARAAVKQLLTIESRVEVYRKLNDAMAKVAQAEGARAGLDLQKEPPQDIPPLEERMQKYRKEGWPVGDNVVPFRREA